MELKILADGANHVSVKFTKDGLVIVKKSPFSGVWHEATYPNVTRAQLELWLDGVLIQDALPHLSPSEREFLMTGITPEEWNKVFKSGE